MALVVSRFSFRTALPEQGGLAGVTYAGRIDVFEQKLLEIVAHGNLAALAALFVEVEHPLVAGVIEVPSLKLGHGAGPGGGVDEDGDDGAVARSHQVRSVERSKQVSCFRHRDRQGLALDNLVAFASD